MTREYWTLVKVVERVDLVETIAHIIPVVEEIVTLSVCCKTNCQNYR